MSNVSIVVETKACSGCGMCAAACPVNAIEIEEAYRPRALDSCNDCGICYEVCPRVEIPYGEIERNLAEKHQGAVGGSAQYILLPSFSIKLEFSEEWFKELSQSDSAQGSKLLLFLQKTF